MDLESLLARVLSLGEEQDWSGAATLLTEHLEEFDDQPAIHCWLGVAERELGMEGMAYERFKRALALEPTDPYVLATAGNGVAAFDDPDAERALRTAALTAPELAVARLLYGAYLSREGLYEEAAAELAAARALDEDDPQVRYELGVLAAFRERWEEAADALAEAVRLAPDDAWIRSVFGLVLLEVEERDEEAAAELDEAARLDENDFGAQVAAALAAAAIGREDLAWEMLERARLVAIETDLVMVEDVEDRLAAGRAAGAALLREEVAPSLLRERLHERP